MKVSEIKKRYRMNKDTEIVIESKKNGDIYENRVVVTHKSVGLEPLFKSLNPTRTELADAVADIDLMSDTVDLFGDKGGEE